MTTGRFTQITPVLGSGTPVVTTRAVGATTKLTGPVFDGSSGLVFVGGANGVLYAVVGSTMTLPAHSTLQVGDASCSSGNNQLADAPLVDGADSFVFETAMTGTDGDAHCCGPGCHHRNQQSDRDELDRGGDGQYRHR